MTTRQTRSTWPVTGITQAQYDAAMAEKTELAVTIANLKDVMIERVNQATAVTGFDHDSNEIDGYTLNVRLNRLDYLIRFLTQPVIS